MCYGSITQRSMETFINFVKDEMCYGSITQRSMEPFITLFRMRCVTDLLHKGQWKHL